jgi:periplasmic divalent cation tolerance protein
VKRLRNSYIIILVTTASREEAETIVQRLLEGRLIACANITGVSSRFRWSGKMEKAEEYLILMKSRQDLFEKLSETVKALHSYEVPEILALPVVEGSKAYMDWLDSCLR